MIKIKPPTTRGKKSAIKKEVIPLKKVKPGEPAPEEASKENPIKDNNMPIPVTEITKESSK